MTSLLKRLRLIYPFISTFVVSISIVLLGVDTLPTNIDAMTQTEFFFDLNCGDSSSSSQSSLSLGTSPSEASSPNSQESPSESQSTITHLETVLDLINSDAIDRLNDGVFRIKPAERGWYPSALSHLPYQALEWHNDKGIHFRRYIAPDCPLTEEEFKKALEYFGPGGAYTGEELAFVRVEPQKSVYTHNWQDPYTLNKYISKIYPKLKPIHESVILNTGPETLRLATQSPDNPLTTTTRPILPAYLNDGAFRIKPAERGWFPLEGAHLEREALEWHNEKGVKFQGWLGSRSPRSVEEYKATVEHYNPKGTTWQRPLVSSLPSSSYKSITTQTSILPPIPILISDTTPCRLEEDIYIDMGQLGIYNTKL
jgi:hypothetical protein